MSIFTRVYSQSKYPMKTVRGFLECGGKLIDFDTGEIIAAYPFGIDAPKVRQQSGYFLLKPTHFSDGTDGYIIVNHLLE